MNGTKDVRAASIQSTVCKWKDTHLDEVFFSLFADSLYAVMVKETRPFSLIPVKAFGFYDTESFLPGHFILSDHFSFWKAVFNISF